jgi:AcrR family transcriptional regulator
MTREDILEAAFQAWGRDAYRKMSLSDVAARLGVTKPAIYRHFHSKEELQNAMMADFFDRFIVRLRTLIAEAEKPALETESTLNVVEGLADYYARNREDLIFTFARLLGMPEPEKILVRELLARGISPTFLTEESAWHDERKARLHFSLATCFFSIALFHIDRGDTDSPPSESEIAQAVANARSLVADGLAFSPAELAAVDYQKIERLARLEASETSEGDGLLPAIAAAVADAGPWNASMELVARAAGLSKSGLYAHFKSREEMLKHLFLSEFERIAAIMSDRAGKSERPIDRLFLAITAASEYLLARQDVLVALDWVRAQRVDLGHAMPETITSLFGFLAEAAARGECRLPTGRIEAAVRWILFLVVNMLMRTRDCPKETYPLKGRMRALYACLCVGIEGW